MDAAHLLHQAVPGQGWIKQKRVVELKTNSGRKRLNVLGAFSPDDQSLVAIEDTVSCDAAFVCRLLRRLREEHPEVPLLLIFDNARYQCTEEVQQLAADLSITLLYLPPYSPNLNLIERFWKFLRKHVIRNRYYPSFAEFRAAVKRLLDNLPAYKDELASLITEKFHLFDATA